MNKKKYEVISTGNIILKLTSKYKSVQDKKNEVDKIWQNERKKNRRIFNDYVLALHKINKQKNQTIVEVKFVPYKLIIADRIDPTLNLKLHQVGVSGLTLIKNKQNLILFSKRMNTTEYPGYLELVPSGNLDIKTKTKDSVLDYKSKLVQELREETHITNTVKKIQGFCFVKDRINNVYDVCCLIEIAGNHKNILENFKSSEYDKPIFIPVSWLKQFVNENKKLIIPTSLAILECFVKLNKKYH
jgi:hypothetical protein